MINANLDLNPQTEATLLELEKNTGLSKDELISNAVNSVFNEEISEEMEDLALSALMADIENNPDNKTYNLEQAKVMLGL